MEYFIQLILALPLDKFEKFLNALDFINISKCYDILPSLLFQKIIEKDLDVKELMLLNPIKAKKNTNRKISTVQPLQEYKEEDEEYKDKNLVLYQDPLGNEIQTFQKTLIDTWKETNSVRMGGEEDRADMMTKIMEAWYLNNKKDTEKLALKTYDFSIFYERYYEAPGYACKLLTHLAVSCQFWANIEKKKQKQKNLELNSESEEDKYSMDAWVACAADNFWKKQPLVTPEEIQKKVKQLEQIMDIFISLSEPHEKEAILCIQKILEETNSLKNIIENETKKIELSVGSPVPSSDEEKSEKPEQTVQELVPKETVQPEEKITPSVVKPIEKHDRLLMEIYKNLLVLKAALFSKGQNSLQRLGPIVNTILPEFKLILDEYEALPAAKFKTEVSTFRNQSIEVLARIKLNLPQVFKEQPTFFSRLGAITTYPFRYATENIYALWHNAPAPVSKAGAIMPKTVELEAKSEAPVEKPAVAI